MSWWAWVRRWLGLPDRRGHLTLDLGEPAGWCHCPHNAPHDAWF